MNPPRIARLPPHIWALAGLYCFASLVHFTHNAEFIALYPNLPASFTREKVYLAWLAITSVGVLGVGLSMRGWQVAAALCLAAYGALGFDGLAHYALALCSQHTLMTNATIWFEVMAGALLLTSCGWSVKGLLLRSSPASSACP